MNSSRGHTCCARRLELFSDESEEVKLVSQTRLLGIIIDDSLSWSPHVDSICTKVGRKIGAFASYVRAVTDPHGKKAIFRLSDSARFGVCCFSNHPVHADWSTRSTSGALQKGCSMHGRCSSARCCLTALSEILKLTHLTYRWSPQLVTTIRRCHQQSAPRRYSWRILVFMSTSMVPCLKRKCNI